MNQPSSSISSSDVTGEPVRRKSWRTLVWAVFWLIVLDVGANVAFAFPADVKNTDPGKMALFFDYGRSMEGRLRRMTRAEPGETAPITLAGWYSPLKALNRPEKDGGAVVTVYGMSHAVRLADALQRNSKTFSARSVGAPGATTNWAYGAFRRDEDRTKSKVVVLAIMSSTLPMISSVSPVTWNEGFPLPYTADRFELHGKALQVVAPPYESFADYVAALGDHAKWAATTRHLARNDPFYDPRLFNATLLDHSTLVRMARRAWGNARDREAAGKVLTARGFDAKSEAVRLGNAIIASFAADARRDRLLPVIYIVNNYGYGDQLYLALRDTLRRENIPYVSSHTVVDPGDPANYLGDTHFTDANDKRLAKALEAVITENLDAAIEPDNI